MQGIAQFGFDYLLHVGRAMYQSLWFVSTSFGMSLTQKSFLYGGAAVWLYVKHDK